MAEERTALDQAVDQLLDLLVYAPVGLAVTAREELPHLIEKGRQRVTAQLVLARMFGQFAVQQGQQEARRRADRLARHAADVAERVTARPAPGYPSPPSTGAPVTDPDPGAGAAAPADVAGVPADAARRPEARWAGLAGGDTLVNGAQSAAAAAAAASARSLTAPAKVADLAIPGYDTLSASHVVQRLAGLSPAELAAVGDYEATTRGRRTILAKVAQLQSVSGEPPAGRTP